MLKFTAGGLGFESWGWGYYSQGLKQLRSEGTALLPPVPRPLELDLTEAKAGPFNLWLTKTNSISSAHVKCSV